MWLRLGAVAAFAVLLFAATPASAQRVITFTKTPSSPTYTTVGQVINYTYRVTLVSSSSGPIDIDNITDNRIPTVTCAGLTFLNVGDSTECTGSYTITAADIAAGSVTNTAILRYDTGDNIFETRQTQATITFVPPPPVTGSITIVKQSTGGSGTFNFTSSIVATPNFTLASGGAGSSRTFPGLVAGTYIFAEVNLPFGWRLTAISCIGDTGGTATVTSLADGSVAVGLDPGEAITCTFLNARLPPGSITIVKQAIGGDNAFNFTSSLPGAASFVLATSGGAATRVFNNLTPGTYTVAEVSLPFRWRLTALSCIGEAGGAPTVVMLAGGSASIGLDFGESIVCTFTNAFDQVQHVAETLDFIRLFLTKRMLLIANDDVDRTLWFRKMPGTLWGDDDGNFAGDGGSTQAFNFTGSDTFGGTRSSFSTSLSQIHRAAAAAERRNNPIEDAFAAFKAKPRAIAAPRFDLWIEGHYNAFWAERSRLNNSGKFGVVYVGADYLVTRSILVGLLGQFDTYGEKSNIQRTSSDGDGFFVGPYMAARLTKNLFFDARAAWGKSDNTINPFGLYEDGFTTNRWLARANLTGNWQMGQFRVTPGAGIIYISEHQHGYIDTLGLPIPSQTINLGRFTVGPEIAYRIVTDSGAIFEPQAALKASWDFDKPAAAFVGGYLISQDDIRLAAQLGLMARFPTGHSWRVAASWDGIGSRNLQSVGAKAWVNFPLP